MIARRSGRHVACVLPALVCALLAVPATALASGSGGGGLGTTSGSGTTTTGATTGTTTSGTTATGTTTAAPTATPSAPVTASGDGVTLTTTSATSLRGRLVLTGTASGADGQTLEIERQVGGPDGSWESASTTTVSDTGTFRAVWLTNTTGRVSLRALVVSGSEARTASAPATLTVTVYPTSRATIYGPGFFGRRTACGGRLEQSTIGVANRSLPCGTKVSLLYDGRTLVVPVIDRGPYANGADWDLTSATAAALGMTGTSSIGTMTASATTAPSTTTSASTAGLLP